MKFIKSNQRILTACLLGMFVIGFTMTSLDEIFEPMWTAKNPIAFNCLLDEDSLPRMKPSESMFFFSNEQTDSQLLEKIDVTTHSHPLAFLFQIMFILFLISPPIIALMLFCIWKELKKRNDLE